jgi:sialidase-1
MKKSLLKRLLSLNFMLIAGVCLVTMTLSCKKSLQYSKAVSEQSETDSKSSKYVSTVLAYDTPYKLFNGNTGIYHSYRIPSIVKAANGTLIAFAEGRVDNNEDYGNINLICRRKGADFDDWNNIQVIAGAGDIYNNGVKVADKDGTFGNPTAVVDQETNRVWLFMSYNAPGLCQCPGMTESEIPAGYTKRSVAGQRKTLVTYSDDNGANWSTPIDRTSTLKPSSQVWDAMGPGIGIQKAQSDAGMLIIPASGRNIYSTNNGSTWQYQSIPGGTSEGTIVERLSGQLMRNDRGIGSTANYRYKSVGGIGNSWSDFGAVTELPDPHCQGSILRYTTNPSRILFLNSASQTTRTAMKIRLSTDEGITWDSGKSIPQIFSSGTAKLGGYSSLVKTPDNMIGALIEFNENTGSSSESHRSIYYHKFNLSWMGY